MRDKPYAQQHIDFHIITALLYRTHTHTSPSQADFIGAKSLQQFDQIARKRNKLNIFRRISFGLRSKWLSLAPNRTQSVFGLYGGPVRVAGHTNRFTHFHVERIRLNRLICAEYEWAFWWTWTATPEQQQQTQTNANGMIEARYIVRTGEQLKFITMTASSLNAPRARNNDSINKLFRLVE